MEYAYSMFAEDIYKITGQIEYSGSEYDQIVALARGGAIAGVVLSHRLSVPVRIIDWSFREKGNQDWIAVDLVRHWVKKGKRILIVDDILDSGETLSKFYEAVGLAYGTHEGATTAHLAVLVRNTSNIEFIPDYYGRTINRQEDKRWVNFWWENKQ